MMEYLIALDKLMSGGLNFLLVQDLKVVYYEYLFAKFLNSYLLE